MPTAEPALSPSIVHHRLMKAAKPALTYDGGNIATWQRRLRRKLRELTGLTRMPKASRPPKVRSPQVRSFQNGVLQVRAPEIRSLQVRSIEQTPAETGAVELGSLQGGQGEVAGDCGEPAEIGVCELRLLPIRLRGQGPMQR